MFYSAKVLGVVFSNPPFHIVRCLVATEEGLVSDVVKGDIPGPVSRGYVFTFKGRKRKDNSGRSAFSVERTPINPKWLKGTSSSSWLNWSSESARDSVHVFSTLSECGASVKLINSIWKDVEKDPKIISDNPWCLVDKGIPFKSADQIAKKLLDVFDLGDPRRVEASISWSLKQGLQNGHVYLDVNTVFRDCGLLTGVDITTIAHSVKDMKEKGLVVVDKDEANKNILYSPRLYNMECEVAEYLNRSDVSNVLKEEITDAFISNHSRYALTEDQILAIKRGLTSGVSILTGLPGTGKTTILNTLVKILISQGEQVLLVAPTGIAAKRASSVTGISAYTIHRAFGAGVPSQDKSKSSDYEGVKKDESSEESVEGSEDRYSSFWKYHPKNPRSESVIIVDEASMVDLHLMWRLLRGISPSCRVVLVGDTAQLPPVGAGFVLKEIIESDLIPRVHLEDIFRQGEGSGVVRSAHDIYRGVVPTGCSDYNFKELRNNDYVLEEIIKVCKELKLDGVDFHVMSPTHHGVLGVTRLNKELRSVLNPRNINKNTLKVGKDEIREGDRVMVTKNDYNLDVFNGDIGVVHLISKSGVEVGLKGTKKEILVEIPRNRVGSLLRLAYCTTVHKAQGQEYHTIVMPMVIEHGRTLLKRSLYYTAITRATDKVFVFGDLDSIEVSVSNDTTNNNLCGLKNRLKYDI